MDISDLRRELGDSLETFAAKVGLSSKGYLSCIERGTATCSVDVAINIERISGGRISAATLNADVAKARESAPKAA